MKVGIIGPTSREIAPFLKMIDRESVKKPFDFEIVEGKYEGVDVVASMCGVGKVNAAQMTQYLIDHYDITHFVVFGAAGAIDPNLAIGDVILGEQIIHHDVDPELSYSLTNVDEKMLSICDQVDQKHLIGKIVTGEQFIDEDGRESIIECFSPLAVDMESAAMGQVCDRNGIPILVIRAITDTPHESGLGAFEKNLEIAVERATDMLCGFLKAL